mgnify:CR=1 FL=1
MRKYARLICLWMVMVMLLTGCDSDWYMPSGLNTEKESQEQSDKESQKESEKESEKEENPPRCSRDWCERWKPEGCQFAYNCEDFDWTHDKEVKK